MRKTRTLLAPCALALLLAGCKPSEANYRAAYERATAARDDADVPAYQAANAQTAIIGGEVVEVATAYISLVNDDGSTTRRSLLLRPYCIEAGRFRQVFNARSMAQRLLDSGFPEAFVAKTADGHFLAIAASCDEPGAALAMLKKAKECGFAPNAKLLQAQ